MSAHEGDGTFADRSWWAGPFAVPGYSIKMNEFDLGQSFQATYKISRLPDIWRTCGLYLAFNDPNGRLDDKPLVKGRIHLELIDSNGNAIINVSGNPSEFTWYGNRDMHALYQRQRSSFAPRTAEQYVVRISYDPEPGLSGFQGYVYLKCGGNK